MTIEKEAPAGELEGLHLGRGAGLAAEH
jgi:hypothetical protein